MHVENIPMEKADKLEWMSGDRVAKIDKWAKKVTEWSPNQSKKKTKQKNN